MEPKLNFAWALVLFVPVVALMAVALLSEKGQGRRDKSDGVLVTWDDLRLTPEHLVVGERGDRQRIPLTGLSARVAFTGKPGQAQDERTIHLIVENADQVIARSLPYTYGSSERAQTLAMRLNMLSGSAAQLSGIGSLAGLPGDRHVA